MRRCQIRLSVVTLALSSSAMLLPGCRSSPVETTTALPDRARTRADSAGHKHEAPHGGTLLELGDEFAHLEIVFDASTGRISAYALNGDASGAVRLGQRRLELLIDHPPHAIRLEGVASPLTGETIDDTSEFAGQSDLLKGAARIDGVIKMISIRGRQFNQVAFHFPPEIPKE